LLHGFTVGTSRLTYGPSIPPLAEHFDVIAPDLPGYGFSEAPVTPYRTDDYARFVCRFLDALEIEKATVVGFSKGGAIALGFALEHPERVHRLVLVSAYALSRAVQVPLLPYLALHTPGLGMTAWRTLRRSKRLLPWYLKNLVFGDAKEVTEELVKEIREPLSREGSERAFMTWLRGETGLLRFKTDYSRRLDELQVPTLLLHGTRDLVVPAARSREAAKRIPQAELRLIRGCGHWLPREATDAFVASVEGFAGGD